MTNLKGIFPALITPFNSDDTIDYGALKALVNMNIKKGVDGFYVGGSTSEAFLLSLDERKKILEIVAKEATGRCNIISHVGCISTKEAIELAKHADNYGVDAVSSIPPFYYDFTLEEIKGYYMDIINSIELPMIVYNFPDFSGVTIDSENAEDLLNNEKVVGLKHTSFDLYQLERMKNNNNELLVFNGRDEIFLAGLAMGADGAIGSTYNFMAEKFIDIKREFENGNQKKAKTLQREANEIIKVLIDIGVFQGIKYILKLKGINCGKTRKPFKSLKKSQKEKLEKFIKKDLL